MTAAALVALMPPMVTTGRRTAARIARTPSSPSAGAVSVLVGVANTGLTLT